MSSSFASIAGQVAEEAERASSIHAPMRSQHEAYAVLLEEIDEFWEEVKRKQFDPRAARKELIQAAAMCLRAIHDLGLTEGATSDPVADQRLAERPELANRRIDDLAGSIAGRRPPSCDVEEKANAADVGVPRWAKTAWDAEKVKEDKPEFTLALETLTLEVHRWDGAADDDPLRDPGAWWMSCEELGLQSIWLLTAHPAKHLAGIEDACGMALEEARIRAFDLFSQLFRAQPVAP